MPHNMVQLMHELSPEFAARDARCDGENPLHRRELCGAKTAQRVDMGRIALGLDVNG